MRLVNLYNPQSPQTGFVVSYQISSMIISCVTVILVVFLCFNTKQLDEFSLLYGLSLLTVDKTIESLLIEEESPYYVMNLFSIQPRFN